MSNSILFQSEKRAIAALLNGSSRQEAYIIGFPTASKWQLPMLQAQANHLFNFQKAEAYAKSLDPSWKEKSNQAQSAVECDQPEET